MDLIIHHKSCPDGFCAAFIAHKRYPEAIILPMDHGTNPPYAEVEDKDVLVLDFSWRTREENIRLSKLAKSFRILDHHKTAQTVLDGLDFATFDMNRSGAGITWDEIYGSNHRIGDFQFIGKPRPWYVNYVEDRDLWRHKLISSEEVNAYIMTLPFTIEAWETLDGMDWIDAARKGEGALAHVRHYVREAVVQAQTGTLDGHPARIINALYMNISEVAGALAQEAGIDIGIGYFERGDGVMQFSLRSRNDVDVSAIATSFGGGGHKNAAGFQLSVCDGRKLVDKILDRKIYLRYVNETEIGG